MNVIQIEGTDNWTALQNLDPEGRLRPIDNVMNNDKRFWTKVFNCLQEAKTSNAKTFVIMPCKHQHVFYMGV